MGVLFNIVSFSLAIALLCVCVVFSLRFLNIRKDLQENEARLLFKKVMNSGGEKEPRAGELRGRELSGLEARLADAGLALKPRAWRTLQLGGSLAAAAFVFLASGGVASSNPIPNALVAAAAGGAVVLGSRGFLASRARKQTLLLEKQLSQIELQIAENSRSGLSISRSVMVCAELADEPLKGHLRRLYNEITYSDTTLAEGFENMANRTGSADVKLLAQVIAVQQQTGSNLAEALEFLHETISRRIEMRQSLRSSLAETKITRNIVAATPWVIFLLLAFCPGIHIAGFWEFYSTNPLGWAVLGCCAIAELAILLLISRMSNLTLD
ncbi:MAG: type II secretion system F family protein [Coriobacteriales bacterium]